jgi:hypothetical protein
MSNVAINISAEYTGKPAFDKASKSVKTLEKSVKRLASGLGVGLGLSAVTTFGKAAVKAFAADEAAALRLTNTVNNLGISFANPAITKFISQLESSAGIADDVLRPAFQALLTTTGSVTQSQKLLGDAITISRGKGVELATVAQDLANGYVGITKGLKKYNTGLTQSELKTKSFSDVLGVLLKQSAGAADAYLDTTSFKFDVLGVAVDNAKEKIGQGLISAFARAAGGSEVSDAVKAIDTVATAINGITLATGTAVGGLTSVLKNLKNLPKNIFQGFAGKQGGINTKPATKPPTPAELSEVKKKELLAKLEKDALKRAKDLAKEQTKLLNEQKKQAALKKASKLFDLEQAGLLAALTRDLTKEEEMRAKAQLALLNGNEAVATSLTKQILMSQDATGNLYKLWQTLPDAKNPFAYLEGYLEMLGKKAAALLSLNPSAIGGFVGTTAVSNAQVAANLKVGATLADLEKTASPWLFGGQSAESTVPFIPDTNATGVMMPSYNFRRAEDASNATGPIQVVVQLDGQTIAQSNQNQSLSGTPSGVSRTSGMFNG